jgi:hypothetical protein
MPLIFLNLPGFGFGLPAAGAAGAGGVGTV